MELQDTFRKSRKSKKLQKKLEQKNYKPSTESGKTLKFMKEEETRQEFKPILGELIDNVYANPCITQTMLGTNIIVYCSRKLLTGVSFQAMPS